MSDKRLPVNQQKLLICREKALKLFNKPEVSFQSRNPTKKLFNEFIQFETQSFKNYTRFYSIIDCDGITLNYIKQSVVYKDKELKVESCRSRKAEALAESSTLMIEKILEISPFYYMPDYIIGLPNYRGHCFFVPFAVPLFNIYEFVSSLIEANDLALGYLEKNRLHKPESYKYRDKPEPNEDLEFSEPEFLWTRIIYKFFLKYKQASRAGEVTIENLPRGIDKKYPKVYGDVCKEAFEYEPGDKTDLSLDRKLIKICLELAHYQSAVYSNEGGFVCKLFHDLINKLDREFVLIPCESPFKKTFFTEIVCEYTCTKCGFPTLKKKISTPRLLIGIFHKDFESIQEYFDNLIELVKVNESNCNEYRKGKLCNEKMQTIRNTKLTHAPEILVLQTIKNIYKESNLTNLKVPDSIDLEVDGIMLNYKKTAFSDTFPVWKNHKGELHSLRHVEMEGNQPMKLDSWHVVAHLSAKEGEFEVNNENVYEQIRCYDVASPDNLLFYVKKKNNFYLPKVGNFLTKENYKVTVSNKSNCITQ